MIVPRPRSPARTYRTFMWVLVVVGLVNLGIAVREALGGMAAQSGVLGLVIFFLCMALGAWLGLAGARLVREEHDRQNRQELLIVMATELGRHDDEALRRIVRQGGPAGEAASMLLKGRREKTR
ncbi:MAG: hypothetical protein ACHQ2E_01405 [Gemmatimonadales bacterium]